MGDPCHFLVLNSKRKGLLLLMRDNAELLPRSFWMFLSISHSRKAIRASNGNSAGYESGAHCPSAGSNSLEDETHVTS